MKPIIDIEHLSKKFRINHAREQYLNLRDSFKNIFRSSSKEDFYALKDINITVNEGDSLGIIGKNGAGKSTLLKIISKITPPTTGSITYRGRVASLLEVGTGFHGELTGRENVFMNGSILGMRRAEIKKNFDAIVDFAGVEKFIDTPLKHYSSGMQLRLAFAVAAFLENEILIIDEVLAVGDAEFQKKCIGKMDEVSKSGRTLLFVSHNMSALKSLCTRGVVLKNATVDFDGDIHAAIDRYNIAFTTRQKIFNVEQIKRKRGTQFITIKEIIFDADRYEPGSAFTVQLRLKNNDPSVTMSNIHLAVFIADSMGNVLYHVDTLFLKDETVRFSEDALYTFTLEKLNLRPGLYSVWGWLQGNGYEQDFVDTDIYFEVNEGNIYGATNPNIASIIQKEFKFSVDI